MAMTALQYLLKKLAEEAGEIAHEALKAMEFGTESAPPGRDENNWEQICKELDGMAAVMQLFEQCYGMRYIPNPYEIEKKKTDISHYHQVSIGEGLCKDGGELYDGRRSS